MGNNTTECWCWLHPGRKPKTGLGNNDDSGFDLAHTVCIRISNITSATYTFQPGFLWELPREGSRAALGVSMVSDKIKPSTFPVSHFFR